jgi:hypothetical protein
MHEVRDPVSHIYCDIVGSGGEERKRVANV